MCLALVYVHFIAGQAGGGGGWAGNKGHFTPRTVPAAAPSAIPAKKGHSRCCKPQTGQQRHFSVKNCFSQHSHHWCCLVIGRYLIS